MRILILAALLFAGAQGAYKYKKIDKREPPKELPVVNDDYLRAADKIFQSGYQNFRKGEFGRAETLLTAILKKYSLSQNVESAALMLAQCHLRRGKDEKARAILRLFAQKYPQSPHLPRCQYLTGILFARDGDGYGAAQRFLYVYRYAQYPVLAKLSASALSMLFEHTMTADQLLAVESRLPPGDSLRPQALFAAGVEALALKSYPMAEEIFERFLSEYSDDAKKPEAVKWLGLVRDKKEPVITLGVIIPQTAAYTPFNEIGQKVLKGVELAVKEYNAKNPYKVKLVVRDDKADPVAAYQVTRELLDREKVTAVIGPLASASVCVAAALTASKGIPMVSPTASASGIDSLGDHVFLLTVTKSAMARTIAEYAFDSLKINEYAILFPNDDYGSAMAGAFRDVIEERGGNLIMYEMYQKGEQNFREFLDRLHERKVVSIFEKRAMEEGVIPGEKEDKRVEVDSSFMADSAIDVGGLFLPGYPEEIAMLVPQVPFYKIHTQLLGATGWYDASVTKNAGRYVENGIVVVDFTDRSGSKEWQGFHSKYNQQYHEAPDPKSALGYDAANLILQNLDGEDSEKLLKKLRKLRKFDGAAAQFTFGEDNHANSEASLLKINDEEFHKIFP